MREKDDGTGGIPTREGFRYVLAVVGEHPVCARVVDPREVERIAYRNSLVSQDANPQSAQVGDPCIRPRIVLVVAGDEEDAVPGAQTAQRLDQRAELLHGAVHEVAGDDDQVGLELVRLTNDGLDEVSSDSRTDVDVGELDDAVAGSARR